MKRALFVFGLMAVGFVGCTADPKSGKGFTLPDGDAERGKQTFVELNCQACHTVSGVNFENAETSPEQKLIALGGAKTYVETYGDLVTSIINPSHRFAKGYSAEQVATEGESKMRVYNDEMTVQQLIDLVTFLSSHYSLKQYDRSPYAPYYY